MDELRYLDWLRSNGATFDAIVYPHETPQTGRGAVLTKSLKAKEPFLTVPDSIIINAPKCRSQPNDLGAFLSSSSCCSDSEEITIAIFLCHERLLGEKSFWFPYIQSLPLNTGSLHSSWTREELNELQDEQFIEEVTTIPARERAQQFALIRSELQSKAPYLFPSGFFTLDLFSWAVETVQCRSFGRRIEHMSLVPLADNLNHGNVPVKYSLENGRFKLFPSRDLTRNEGPEVTEAFNSYGRRSNANLLMGYGFALENNEWDDVQLELELPPMASVEKKKLFNYPGPFIVQFRVGTIPHHFLRFFRLIYATKEQVRVFKSLAEGGFQFVSLENERVVLATSKREVEELLISFPTSIDEDRALLEGSRGNLHLTYAIRYRLGRKQSLYFTLIYLARVSAWVCSCLDAKTAVSEECYVEKTQAILSQLVEEQQQNKNE